MFNAWKRQANPRIPILTYHSLNAPGLTYGTNDHIALAEDLKVIRSCGFRVVPVHKIVDAVIGSALPPAGNCVGITFDDGVDFDYLDVVRPELGLLKSFARVLREPVRCARQWTYWPRPTAVSFVIASPAARRTLDRTCIAGLGEWTDSWWRAAHEGGVLQIANHSWDHTHSSLDTVAQRDQIKGTFMDIDTWGDADRQIRQAEDYIEGTLGRPSARLFAVPYGCSVEYPHREYLPDFVSQHRQRACFETGGEYVTLQSNRWRLPRFTFGEHWKAPEDLVRILAGAISAAT